MLSLNIKDYIIAALTIMLVSMGIFMWIKCGEYEAEIITFKVGSESQKRAYDSSIKVYENAIDDTGKFLVHKLDEIEKLKRGANETECDAAFRFLDKYGD
ncbi:MAG TPA: hypothetical protein CFH81_02085 [Sulfurovum sp. UBA12169]|nr:MAG TPA: hypothetical protein CFH81_02085 [Sulfurovum sp. UBA12169]